MALKKETVNAAFGSNAFRRRPDVGRFQATNIGQTKLARPVES